MSIFTRRLEALEERIAPTKGPIILIRTGVPHPGDRPGFVRVGEEEVPVPIGEHPFKVAAAYARENYPQRHLIIVSFVKPGEVEQENVDA